MFLTNVTSFSAGFCQRHGAINDCIELRIDSLQGRRQFGRLRNRMLLEGCQGRSKDSCFQARHQPRYLPAIRSEKVAMRSRRAEDQPLQSQASQIVRHLGRRVGRRLDSQQVRQVTMQVTIVEALNQEWEQALY